MPSEVPKFSQQLQELYTSHRLILYQEKRKSYERDYSYGIDSNRCPIEQEEIAKITVDFRDSNVYLEHLIEGLQPISVPS